MLLKNVFLYNFKVEKKVTVAGREEGNARRLQRRFLYAKKRQMKRTKRDYGNVVLERKNFPHIILKYVLCGGRVEIVAPYP